MSAWLPGGQQVAVERGSSSVICCIWGGRSGAAFVSLCVYEVWFELIGLWREYALCLWLQQDLGGLLVKSCNQLMIKSVNGAHDFALKRLP